MPHHKSAAKRVKTNEIRRERNVAARTRARHALRELRAALAESATPATELTQKLANVASLLDQMAGKGLIHRNKAARLKSRLHHRLPR